jgi:hypothetical protein
VQVRVRWETEGFVWKLSDSCHQHACHEVDTYVLVIQGGCSLGGFGLWRDVCNILAFFVWPQYFDQGSSFRLLFLRVDCERNQSTFLAIVFNQATTFNRDLNQWDVAKVATMSYSKWRMT